MERPLETGYALGRLGFGLTLIAAAEKVGELLMGDEARRPAGRISLRFYGTRDTVLGLGMLRALAAGQDVDGWLEAGIASDVLDTIIQLAAWDDLPAENRAGGVALALGAAGAGVALLARGR